MTRLPFSPCAVLAGALVGIPACGGTEPGDGSGTIATDPAWMPE